MGQTSTTGTPKHEHPLTLDADRRINYEKGCPRCEWLHGKATPESFTVDQIKEAFRKHAHEDDWGVKSFYESGLLAALRGEYDD